MATLSNEQGDRLGYRVAADAAAADDVLANGAVVDLVLSDVVLPGGTSGPEFAERALERHPGLKVVFMSGYPAEMAKRTGFIGSENILLNKPFRKRDPARGLRSALD